MKIGIEASRLIEHNRTGTENYLYHLVKEWAVLGNFSANGNGNEYILYFRPDTKPSEAFWQELTMGNPNFSYVVPSSIFSWTQFGLALALFKNSPDILLCPWHTMPAFHPFKTKIVSVIHDLTGKKLPTRWTVVFSNKVIAVSNFTKTELVKRFRVNPAKINVVLEGYSKNLKREDDASIHNIKLKYDIAGDYMFFLGSIGPRKNIERMIEASDAINLEFVLAGSVMKGSEDMLELPAKFLGRVPDEDLAALYSGAKFLAFVSNEEGFGLPILEAMSCGTPVLTSNVSATSEVAGGAALLADPSSVTDIQEKMRQLLVDENLRNDLIEKGYKRIDLFSWESTATQILEVCEILGKKEEVKK